MSFPVEPYNLPAEIAMLTKPNDPQVIDYQKRISVARTVKFVNGLDTTIKPPFSKKTLEEMNEKLKNFLQETTQNDPQYYSTMRALQTLNNIRNSYDQLPWPEWAEKPTESLEELVHILNKTEKALKHAKIAKKKNKLMGYISRLTFLIGRYNELPNSDLPGGRSILKDSFFEDWQEVIGGVPLHNDDTKTVSSFSGARRRLGDNVIEMKLRNLVNKDIPKTMTIDGEKYYISRAQLQYIKNEEEKAGGFLPLLPLILGGIAAAGSVAGGSAAIAQAVNKKKAEDMIAAEQVRHNKEMEALAKGTFGKGVSGKGLYLDPPSPRGGSLKEAIKDFARKSGLEEGGKRLLKNTLYNLADSVKLEPSGNGIFLSPS